MANNGSPCPRSNDGLDTTDVIGWVIVNNSVNPIYNDESATTTLYEVDPERTSVIPRFKKELVVEVTPEVLCNTVSIPMVNEPLVVVWMLLVVDRISTIPNVRLTVVVVLTVTILDRSSP